MPFEQSLTMRHNVLHTTPIATVKTRINARPNITNTRTCM